MDSYRLQRGLTATASVAMLRGCLFSFLFSKKKKKFQENILLMAFIIELNKLIFKISNIKKKLKKVMAPHSSTLAWKIPWTEKPGGLPSMGSRRVGHN